MPIYKRASKNQRTAINIKSIFNILINTVSKSDTSKMDLIQKNPTS